LAIIPGYNFREHYFILLLPAIGIIIAIGVGYIHDKLLGKICKNRMFIIMELVFCIAIILLTVFINKDYYLLLSPVDLSRSRFGYNPFPESKQIAEYITANSTVDDKIQVLGSEPQIYFYANRLSASGHIYMYGLMEKQKYAELMQKELIADIENNKPKFIIYVIRDDSWLIKSFSEKLIIKWTENYLIQNYNLVGFVEYNNGGDIKFYWAKHKDHKLTHEQIQYLYQKQHIFICEKN
jgi:hypothetical protein